MSRALRLVLLPALGLLSTAALPGREALGIFDGWAAFRDAPPASRCYAIAGPARETRPGRWRPFVSVATWPGRGITGQLHVRLRDQKKRETPVYLGIGDRRLLLASGGADAWAPDARTDAKIVAAMRSGSSMSVEAVNERGRPFVEVYRLRGAATAIDAAALACAGKGNSD